MGLAYGAMGQMDMAFRAFRKGGTIAQAYNNLGCVYLNQSQFALAVECFEKAIALSPQFYGKASENLRNAQFLASNRVP